METWYYVVDSIDGDYANLKRTDIESDELKLVARALLPADIEEGSTLKYELMQYFLFKDN
ncbi:MAG: chorismate--pyruvate lyase [Pseudobutyrivibrio ruminis]|uniref:Chorismate--pyruvate lyase n=1 Tax=Pseudobutyrivibrio ruminis TaxID=46206 RepID=A0A927UC57_9FIRM|nr:chorismate--pyruvate lyase [Pseudobutyrivibrio ruminis]